MKTLLELYKEVPSNYIKVMAENGIVSSNKMRDAEIVEAFNKRKALGFKTTDIVAELEEDFNVGERLIYEAVKLFNAAV